MKRNMRDADRVELAALIECLTAAKQYTLRGDLYADVAVALGCTVAAAEIRCRRHGPNLAIQRSSKQAKAPKLDKADDLARVDVARKVAKRYAWKWRNVGLVEFSDLLGVAFIGTLEGETQAVNAKIDKPMAWWWRKYAGKACIDYVLQVMCPVHKYGRPTSNQQRMEMLAIRRGPMPDGGAAGHDRKRSNLLDWVRQGVQAQLGIFAGANVRRQRVAAYLLDDTDGKTLDRANNTARVDSNEMRPQLQALRGLQSLYDCADWLH